MDTLTLEAQQAEINQVVAEALTELSPDVQRIRYDIRPDSDGEPAIFFRVLLSDEASNDANRPRLATEIVRKISDKIDIPRLNLFPYFNFRTESDQAERNDPGWS